MRIHAGLRAALCGHLGVVAAAALVIGCQGPPPGGPARLEVAVLQGFARPEAPLADAASPVTLVVDARSDEAVERAVRFVDALPATTPLEAFAFGHQRGADACEPGRAIAAGSRGQLAARLGALPRAGRGSLAAALESAMPTSEPARSGGRAVVFSAFEPSDGCADVCEQADRLAALDVLVDWVVVGDGEPPACLASRVPALRGPGPIASSLAPTPPTFQVRAGSGAAGDALAAGRAGDTVTVVPGESTVWIDLDPPEAVGPLRVRPGDRLKLVVLDFPMADPPVRSWWVEGAETRGAP